MHNQFKNINILTSFIDIDFVQMSVPNQCVPFSTMHRSEFRKMVEIHDSTAGRLSPFPIVTLDGIDSKESKTTMIFYTRNIFEHE